jgi:hypothetical protein
MSDTFHPSPSSNGTNGAGNGRDPHGRFTQANPGGPGNPFGRKVAALRTALIASVTEQDVQNVMAAMSAQAVKGNVAAARLYLAYSAGKPAEAVNPDRVDIEEWQLAQESVARPDEVKHTFENVPIEVVTDLARAALPAIGDGFAEQLAVRLKAPVADTGDDAVAEAEEVPVADSVQTQVADSVQTRVAVETPVADAPGAPDESVAAALAELARMLAATPVVNAPGSPAASAPAAGVAAIAGTAPSPIGSNGAAPRGPAEPHPTGSVPAGAPGRGAVQSINRNPLQTVMARRPLGT